MEKGGGGGEVEPATSAAGGMCDRFLTFLAKNLSVRRKKSITEGPRSGGGGVGHPPPTEGGDGDGGVEEDEFAVPIERAEFDFQLNDGHGDGGHSSVVLTTTTILEESAATTTTTRDVADEQKDGATASAAAAADGPAAAPVVPAVEETTKVRRTGTIKEDRPAQDGGASATATATATVERKKSLFRKRQASSVGAGEEGGAGRVPKRSGLRPRMPQVPRVPSNINERSSTFIEERKKSFGRKPAPEK